MKPPEITSEAAKKAYLSAVFNVTGVYQVEVRRRLVGAATQYFIAKMWPLTFTEEQQQAIMVEFVVLRMEQS